MPAEVGFGVAQRMYDHVAAERSWHGGQAGLADEWLAVEQGVEADEAWSTSELRSLTPVFD